jgi:metal-responsive CopG/Arc/MetJ family transcriptional regulator
MGSQDHIRTSIDIPKTLHRKLHEAAARRGCSARQLILSSIERVIAEEPQPRKRRLSMDKAIIPSRGKIFDLTNEQIYDLIQFP